MKTHGLSHLLTAKRNKCNAIIPKFPSRWGNLGIVDGQKKWPSMVTDNQRGPL